MKYIDIPQDVELTTILGEEVMEGTCRACGRGGGGKAKALTFKDFIYARMTDPAFLAKPTKLEGLAGALLVMETKMRLDDEFKRGDGVLAIEDEQHKRFMASIETPEHGFVQEFMHLVAGFMIAVRDASSEDPRAKAA